MKNLKIGTLLILSFIIVTLLSSVAGVTGLAVSYVTDRSYSQALVTNGFSQGDIGRFNTYLNKGAALVRDVIFLTDPGEIESARAELEELSVKTSGALEALRLTCQTPEELELMSAIDRDLPKYRELRDQVVSLGVQNQNEQALSLFRSQARPLLNACMSAADTLADKNVQMGNEASDRLTAQSNRSTLLIILTLAVSLAVSIAFGAGIARSISRPLKEIEAAAKEMAEGKLGARIAYTARNELGSLSESMRIMMKRIGFYMDSISAATKQLAEGDLNVRRQETFLGDFLPVQLSIRNLVSSLNETLGEINLSADQVAAGSGQVSDGAQALSQGAAEQASTVEELAAAINEISGQVRETAENAGQARTQTQKAGEDMSACNRQMRDMMEAMEEISAKSAEIEKIIKTIEDIAFQTNILALNAAVEAARAGAAGKGFAVVADEVRNLAGKSAEASQNTSQLIAGSIQAVQRGVKIADSTARSLLEVVEGAKTTSDTVERIAQAAGEQAQSIAQVTQGIEQISSVVQQNSATAEESAAASEELNGQAQMLRGLVGRFTLSREKTGLPDPVSPGALG